MPDERVNQRTMKRREALLREIREARAGAWVVLPDDNRWCPISLTAAGLCALLGFVLGTVFGLEAARTWGQWLWTP